MISKNLYVNLIVRVLIIVAIALITGCVIAAGKSFRLIILCLFVVVLLTVNLVAYLNSLNRKIRYFFDSVKNDDSNLTFPVSEKNRTIREIYKSMNNVNRQIQDLKIENRNQEKYFRILIEHLAIGIITFDKKGFIVHSNTSARNLIGAEVLTHLGQIERIDRILYQAISGIKPSERRLIRVMTEKGEIQLSLKAAGFRSRNDELMIVSVQDIKNELDEKETESWMKLIGILMHEIMNSITPITSLSGSLTGIYTREGKPVTPDEITQGTISTTLQGLNVIRDQGKSLLTFVESYRQLTRIPEPQKRSFRVAALFERLGVLFSSMKKDDRISLEFSIIDESLEIFADENLISQVLINLLKNAFEALEDTERGRIIISAKDGRDGRPEICVTDDGPGIPSENIDKIFVPFFTTRETGSGIGLSVSRQIMRMHGGSLRVRSKPGKETTFCLSF